MSEILTNLLSDIQDTSAEPDTGANDNEVDESENGQDDESTVHPGGDSDFDSDESPSTKSDDEKNGESQEEGSENNEEEDGEDEEGGSEELNLDDDTLMEFDGEEVELGQMKEAWKNQKVIGQWADLLKENPIAASVQLVGKDATWKHIEKLIADHVQESNMTDDERKTRDAEKRLQEVEARAKELEEQAKLAEEQRATAEYHSFLSREVPVLFKEYGLDKHEASYDLLKVHLYKLHESEGRIATKEDLAKFTKHIQKTLGVQKTKNRTKLPPAPGTPGTKRAGSDSVRKSKPKVSMEDYFNSLRDGTNILED